MPKEDKSMSKMLEENINAQKSQEQILMPKKLVTNPNS